MSSSEGKWKIAYSAKVMGIHCALLHDGKVLLISYPSMHKQGKGGDNHEGGGGGEGEEEGHQHSLLGSASHRGAWELVDPENWTGNDRALEKNIFCGGHCFLDNGELFVSGGQYQAIHNPLLLFDPPSICNYTFNSSTEKWLLRKRTLIARWYPSCVTLPNGGALIISGASGIYGVKKLGAFRFVNNRLQVYYNDKGLRTLQKIPFIIDLYPFMHILPNNRIFVHSERTTRIYNHINNEWEKRPNSSSKMLEINTNYEYSRTNPVQGTSVLLPLNQYDNPPYNVRIMLIGGGGESENPEIDTPATETCEIIDFSNGAVAAAAAAEPTWKYTTSMNFKRVMPNAILLPDGKILVVNGCEKGKSDAGADPVLTAELFDPLNQSWTKLAQMSVKRLYHASALLLPDGRVMTAGTDKEWNKGKDIHDEYRIEVFTPPYLMEKRQPEIINVKSEINYGENVGIECEQGGGGGGKEEVVSAALIKPSSVTHSLNTDQRYIGLEIHEVKKNLLTVQIPNDSNIAPLGYYMLFILNKGGTPSKAKFVRIVEKSK